MEAREKISYLKGLIDGQNLTDTPENEKFYGALVDALNSLAEAIEGHEIMHQDLNDYLEQLDDDVTEIEDELDELLDDDEECYDDDYEEFDEEEYTSVKCPFCEKDFYFEPAMYDEDEDLICPHCGKGFKVPEPE
ncbi:MAG: hypothetical protein GXZ18_02490 [Synergistaceae bacterium]|nr:hypothetical protein [Synergistaceae bacterium]